jgi:transcriptional regulator of heat shock response
MGKEIVYHSGNVSSQDVDRVLSVIETKLEGENKNIVKKILFLSVETLQNIIHHSDKNTKGETLSYFELIKENDYYSIKTGNLITNENTQTLSDRLHCILSLCEEKIKESISNRMSDCEFSDKGGAGIGLLSIHKKTHLGLNFEIEYFEGDYNFIHFEIKI